jgi:hypothetical protein
VVTVGETLDFFDASCLIAASGRPEGGAGFVLSLRERRLLRGAVSLPVLVEAERNIGRKLRPGAVGTYRALLARTPLMMAGVPPARDRGTLREITGEKDEHVLAAATTVGAPFLLTLDAPLAPAVNAAALSIRALSPGEFINDVLPHHTAVDSIRN